MCTVQLQSKGLFTVGDSDRVSDFLKLLALAICIHSERLAILYRIYRELLIAKMGATPIPDLVIATSQSLMLLLMLTVNRPIVQSRTHSSDVAIAIAIAHCE